MEVLWVPADLTSLSCVLSKKQLLWTKINWQGMRPKHCNRESQGRSVMPDSLWPHGIRSPWNSPGQNTGVGSLALLQGVFPTQGSNPGLPHCTWILYQLSHQESPIMLQSWGEGKTQLHLYFPQVGVGVDLRPPVFVNWLYTEEKLTFSHLHQCG